MKQIQELVRTVRKIDRYERRIGAYDTIREGRIGANEDPNRTKNIPKIIKY